jgi:prepilin-type N-terminal cleavage/methylation domain-containing protein
MKLRAHRGMTVLELMIVLAIIAAATLLLRTGFRVFSKSDLVENSTELTAILRRTSTLAVEHGEMHRVLLDLDKQVYVVEVCQGALSIARNEALRADPEEKKRQLDKAKDRLLGMPAPNSGNQVTDPEETTRRSLAVVGHHIADRNCMPATDSITGDSSGKGWQRALRASKGIKFKEVWVQHRDESATKGQVAIYFFPDGSSEKSVIEITDGSEVYSVLIAGLTGRVDLKDGEPRDVNDVMMRNAMGEKDAKREVDK